MEWSLCAAKYTVAPLPSAPNRIAAICPLIATAAANRTPIRSDLIDLCRNWLDVYIGRENEPYLRGLVDYVMAPCAIRSK